MESEGSMTNLHILIIWTKYLNCIASPFEKNICFATKPLAVNISTYQDNSNSISPRHNSAQVDWNVQ